MSTQSWSILFLRICFVIMIVVIAVEFSVPNDWEIILASLGFVIILSILVWRMQDTRAVFRRIVPAFVPPPAAAMIAPLVKTLLKVSAPKKLKLGESTIVEVEMYSFTIHPLIDISDTVLKRVLGGTKHDSYSITLESPSFEYAPKGASTRSVNERFPLFWKWVLEPKSLGTKFVHLYLSDEIQSALDTALGIRNPIEIMIAVVSQMGLSRRTTYWLQRIGAVSGVLLTLPFLAPLFKKIGEKIATELAGPFHQWISSVFS